LIMMYLIFKEALTDSLMTKTNYCSNSDMKSSKILRLLSEEKK
jgi:hypothetical protein